LTAVRVKVVVPAERSREFTDRLIHLDAAIDGILLIPQQAALDVYVLERESVLTAHQRRQGANLE
jgi:hypothetical protein